MKGQWAGASECGGIKATALVGLMPGRGRHPQDLKGLMGGRWGQASSGQPADVAQSEPAALFSPPDRGQS